MPPKRAAAMKGESPSRRKVGRPKRMEAEEPAVLDEPVEEIEEEAVEEAVVSPTAKRRGRPKKGKTSGSTPDLAEADDPNTITLNIEDLIEMGAGAQVTTPPQSSKKRKAPAKSSAAKKSKSDASFKDLGGAGDGENLIQCSLCDAKVVQLVRHIRAQHGDDPDYDSKIKEARSLEAKVQSSTPRKSASNLLDDLTITVGKMVKEPIIDRRTIPGERGNNLVRPKNTQCPICEKVVRRYDLNKHIRNVHSGEKPNKCPYCDYASPWKGNLNTHIAGVHTKARLHDCIRCGLSFKTRSAMIGHVRKVHDKMYQPKERLFECEECNKKFYKKFHLQRHIRVHTGEKPFVCAFCEKMFASKTNMDSHIQSVHLKIKPFKCGYCEKGFARKKMMLIHIRKHHMNRDDSAINLAAMIDVDDITMDDNLDNESTGSVESGEILDGEDAGMVLIKMREEGADDADDAVKQYMFVPADNLPSDLDNTLDSTLNTTTADQSTHQDMDTSTATAEVTQAKVIDAAEASSSALDQPSAEIEEEAAGGADAVTAIVEEGREGTPEPVVINMGDLTKDGQVVQALQTEDGIMLVTQSATITDAVDETSTSLVSAEHVEQETSDEPMTEQPAEVEQEGAEESVEAEPEANQVPESDLVQQAISETVPEVTAETEDKADVAASPSKGTAVLNTDLTAGLPANLLATEEGEHGDAANGEVETYFIQDMPATNGNETV